MIIELNDGKDFLEFKVMGGQTVEIVDILVRTSRRTGIGTNLVGELIDRVEKPCRIYAFARSENAIAAAFYKRLGFSRSVVLKKFYLDDNADAALYTKVVK